MNIPTMPLTDTNNHTDDLDNSANTSNNNNNNNNFSLPNSYRIRSIEYNHLEIEKNLFFFSARKF